ncbi:MAG: DMT family transporter [Rhodobacteraceae bacterium]|nr:DMT family transporter [Paracoccaceae bacterium]
MRRPANLPSGPLFALAAFALFATHDVIVKILGASYAPTQIVFFSVLFGFPLLNVTLIGNASPGTLRPKYPGWTALRTLAVVCTGACTFYAFSNLALTEVYALLFTQPLLITLLAIPLLGERVGWQRRIAVFAGLCGVLIVLRPGPSGLSLAHGAALFAACGGALASVIVRKIGREERSAVLLLYPMLANVIVMGASLAIVYKPMPIQDLGAAALVACFGFAGMSLMIYAYRNGTAGSVAPMQYSQILWATLFGALLFDELPDGATVLGAAVIIASGIFILWRESAEGVSENQPVLRTRSRTETGTYPRISPAMQQNKFKGQSPDE